MPTGGDYPVLSIFHGYTPLVLAGQGTAENPYLISDPNDIGAIFYYDLNAYYQLTADIDLSEITWSIAPIPIFNGVFDGNGI